MTTIGKRLRYLLNKHHMRAVDLSRQIRLPLSTISNILNDRYEPGVYKIQQLARFFQVDLNWLITGESPLSHEGKEIPYIVEEGEQIISSFDELGLAIAGEIEKLPPEIKKNYWDFLVSFYQILLTINR